MISALLAVILEPLYGVTVFADDWWQVCQADNNRNIHTRILINSWPTDQWSGRQVFMTAPSSLHDQSTAIARRLGVMAAQLATAPLSETRTSVFDNVPIAPPDAILGLNAAFREDTHPAKVNLGVGAYRDDNGLPYVLPVVRRIEQQVANDLKSNHEYLPQQGLEKFASQAAKLLLGEQSGAIAEHRVVTVQSLSGTGALRVAFAFLRKFCPAGANTAVYVPKPTWSNHKNVIPDADLRTKEYRYFDFETGGVDIEGMLEDINKAAEGSCILLHSCAHNRKLVLSSSSHLARTDPVLDVLFFPCSFRQRKLKSRAREFAPPEPTMLTRKLFFVFCFLRLYFSPENCCFHRESNWS